MTTWQEANKKTNERITALGKRVTALEGLDSPGAWMPKVDLSKWKLVKTDDLSAKTPAEVTALWGKVDAVDPSRLTYHLTGGPDGGPYRNLCPLVGDENLWDNDRRAELGLNAWEPAATNGYGRDTFHVFREGDHCLTTVAMRLPTGFLVDDPNWKTVFDQKQAEIYANDNDVGPMHEIQVRGDGSRGSGAWHPMVAWHDVGWTFPAHTSVWVFIAAEIVYSQNPAKGSVQYSFTEQGGASQVSPVYSKATLATEHGKSEVPLGGPIPCHQRLGLYCNTVLPQLPGLDFGRTAIYAAI
jgi:hypothetical protein